MYQILFFLIFNFFQKRKTEFIYFLFLWQIMLDRNQDLPVSPLCSLSKSPIKVPSCPWDDQLQ